VVNTPFGTPGNSGPRLDGYEIRTAAVGMGVPCITTVQGMAATVQGVEALRRGDLGVRSLQDLHAALAARQAAMQPAGTRPRPVAQHGPLLTTRRRRPPRRRCSASSRSSAGGRSARTSS
jgi:hypothetical protein